MKLPQTSRAPHHVLRFTHYVSRTTFYVLVLLTIGWSPYPQEQGIVVTGQVTNGTLDGTVPADLPVTLHTFSEMEETGVYTTTLTPDNSFYFDDVALEEGNSVRARVVYQDVAYFSDFVEAEQAELELPVTIYETTEDPSDVQITQLHLFVNKVGDHIQVGEYHLVGNTGDRTFVGVENAETGQQTTLNIFLPDGAEGLSFDGPGLGERFLEQENGFADSEPILPGDTTVDLLFSYELSYREGMQVERIFDAPVVSIALLLYHDGSGLVLEGEGIIPGDAKEKAITYMAGPLEAGSPFVFKLVAGSPAMSPAPAGVAPSRNNTARETAIGLAALAVAVAVVYWMYRSPAPGPLPSQARPVVEKIAALDADFEAGRVAEGAYRKKRGSLERQVRASLKE